MLGVRASCDLENKYILVLSLFSEVVDAHRELDRLHERRTLHGGPEYLNFMTKLEEALG